MNSFPDQQHLGETKKAKTAQYTAVPLMEARICQNTQDSGPSLPKVPCLLSRRLQSEEMALSGRGLKELGPKMKVLIRKGHEECL